MSPRLPCLHWVDGPDDKSEASNGSEEVADFTALARGRTTAVNNQVPDDEQVSNAGNGVPAPLLWSALRAESGEQAGEDHNNVSDDGHEDGTTVHAGQQAEVEEQERGGDAPVDVACVVDFTVEVVLGVWDVLVRLALNDVMVPDAVAGSHGEVGQSSRDRDDGRDNVVQALRLRIVSGETDCFWVDISYHRDAPGHAGEDYGRDDHENEDNPRVVLASKAFLRCAGPNASHGYMSSCIPAQPLE